MANNVLHTVDLLQSIAASGTANPVISVPQGTQRVVIRVSAEYAAVAATSGISVNLQVSPDGTTWVNAGEMLAKVNPAAGVLGSNFAVMQLGNSAFRVDMPSNINSIKVQLTNSDATNAATVAVSHEMASFVF